MHVEVVNAASSNSGRLTELLQGLRRDEVEANTFDKGLLVCSKKGFLDAAAKFVIKGAKNYEQCTEEAIRFRNYNVAALLLLCAGAQGGDVSRIRGLFEKSTDLSEKRNSPMLARSNSRGFSRSGALSNVSSMALNEPHLSEIRRALREGRVKTVHIINVALRAQQKEAALELLLHTDCNRLSGHVDWHGLALRHIDPAWVLAVSSWVQRLLLASNGLTKVS